MTEKILATKIDAIMRECTAHRQRMEWAANELCAHFPLTENTLKNLSPQLLAILDQFLYRFTKLQDALGVRLISLTADFIRGDRAPHPFIDNLNLLARHNLLASADDWLDLRDLRNRLTHEYLDDVAQTATTLNTLMNDWQKLTAIYDNLRNFWQARLPEVTR